MNLLTRRRVSAGLAVVLSTGVCAIASHALAASNATSTQSVKFGAETWYQPDPSCMLPTGCVSAGVTPPATNPYGAGTLHVSVAAGTSAATETSRTYLKLGAVVLGAGVTITSATFVAPLDTTSTTGSTMPETSTTHVCSSTGVITASEGEFDSPPDTNCQNDVALSYAATPNAALTGDLAPLLNAHLADLSAGKLALAILPLNPPMTAAWHDVFDSNDGANAATTPTLNLTFASADDSAPVVVLASPSDSPDPVDSPTAAVAAPVVKPLNPSKPLPVTSAAPVTVVPAPVAVAAVPPTTVVPAPVSVVASAAPAPQLATTQAAIDQAPAASDPQVQAVQQVASTRTVGFAYPAVLLLPLLLIAGGAGLARIMTRDVSPKSDR